MSSTYTSITYHTLDDPLNPKQLPNRYSDLHTLYPGRPMDATDNPDLYAIEPEDPKASKKMFRDVKEKTAEYGASLERKARRQGGGEKMTVNAVEDPAMIVEDPNLQNTNMLNPDETPLLMDAGTGTESSSEAMLRDRSHKKPMVENYRSDVKDEKGTNKTRWILMVFAAVGLFLLAYFYATRQIDMYAF